MKKISVNFVVGILGSVASILSFFIVQNVLKPDETAFGFENTFEILSIVLKFLKTSSLALISIAFLVMVFLQVIKDIFPIRRIYQKYWIRKWLDLSIGNEEDNDTLQEIINLSMAGDSNALFSLPSEQLATQFNKAAYTVLDYPEKYSNLLPIFAKSAEKSDIETIISYKPKKGGIGVEKESRYVASRNRITNQIERTVDTLQVKLSRSWQRIMKLYSIMLSLVFLYLVLRFLNPSTITTIEGVVALFILSLLVGFIAPILRDIVYVIQGYRFRDR